MNSQVFNKGDRVIYTGLHPTASKPEMIGWSGTINHVTENFDGTLFTIVEWDNGKIKSHLSLNLAPLEYKYVPTNEGDKETDI